MSDEVPRKRGRKIRRNRRGRDVSPAKLSPMHGPASHGVAIARLQMAERREKVYNLYVTKCLTMAQIAKHLGVSNYTVCKDLHYAMDQHYRHAEQAGKKYVAVELSRTNYRDRMILPKLFEPESALKAHERLTASSEFRAKLLGLGKPDGASYTAEQVLALMRAVTADLIASFQADEHRALIAQVFRRQFSSHQLVDVQVVPDTPTTTEAPGEQVEGEDDGNDRDGNEGGGQ